jgi:sugar lactone lactonase YvrE
MVALVPLRLVPLALALALGAASGNAAAAAIPTGSVNNFGPNLQLAAGGGCRQPEGLAIDPDDRLYASSNSDTATTLGHICVVDRTGRLADVIDVPAGEVPAIGLLGELWAHGRLYVVDQADDTAPHGRLLVVDPASHTVRTLANGFAFPNAIVQDRNGNLYVSDSLQGRIYRFAPDGTHRTIWVDSPALRSINPDLRIGANGMAFDRTGRMLYVANTGNRQILRIPVNPDGGAGAVQIFADGAQIDGQLELAGPVALFGADGIQFDVRGNLYVMANQVNEIQVLSPAGRLIQRYAGTGDTALDFNASAVFDGRRLFITNMSAADGGVNSKLSVLTAPFPGLAPGLPTP